MRRTVIAIVSSILLTSALVLGGPIPADRAASAQSGNDVIGSWLVELTGTEAKADQPATPALATFFADGSFIASDLPVRPSSNGDVSPGPSPSAAPIASPAALLYTTAGQGIWTATGSVRAALTFVELVTDGTGSVVATVTVSATVRVDETGDAMAGPYSVTSVGADGQALPDSSGTLQGTRIKIALIADFTGNQDAGTLDVAFLDKSTGDPTGWTWDFGDGHGGTRHDPTHSYAEAGDYQVTLTVTTADSTATKTRTITVDPVPAPAADFSSDQDTGSLGMQFTDTSNGDPTSWSWDFGDGHGATRQNPAHTYAKAGDYQVKLTIKNAGGSDSKTTTVTVKPVPSAAADFTSKQAAGTLDVRFSDGSTGKPTSWSWDFGDGHVATRQNPTHSYAKAGDYQVKLTIKNAGGSDSKTRTVTVDPVASASPVASPSPS
jgi:PKD repeat protein